ncbi:SEC-C metal-binding domain-containing protein [Sphingobium sp. Z007]|uniref:SEC-C metal-binding domain-containing protein n=1 Tax=Sphingobium sp. Z007 TaxID=627495 RepID=UPI0020CD16CC|nr:SEC-C metal-binding domain-containing protein [Sphingobium sp. Z007]
MAEERQVEVIDERQLGRIEAVHRGFLYQHLYASICLLMAGAARVQRIVVEADEDVELVLSDRRIYVQIKSRVGALGPADVSGALDRFDEIRKQHAEGARPGGAVFVIASNAPPSNALQEKVAGSDWPEDVALHWPDGPDPAEACLPVPPRSVPKAVAVCSALAATLPFGLLRPETLTWKLASIVMFASAGAPPRQDHSFSRDELAGLFEQLFVQMQDFPAPPPVYRAQIDEPPLLGEEKVRIVSGLSGAGKTAWVAEAALHAPLPVTYLDVVDTPGPALASAVAREVAGRMFGRTSGKLGEILLPGASGLDMLGALSVKLGEEALHANVVIDNAHRVPANDLEAIVARAPNLRLLLLCQPGSDVGLLESRFNIRAETLSGWDEDTIASAVQEAGCRADFGDCERLSRLTGGLPFYVLSTAMVAAREYEGAVRDFCADVEAQTHIAETAQEIILKRAFEGLPPADRETVAVLSLADFALSRDEAIRLIRRACDLDAKAAAARLRALPSTGTLELFGNAGLKVHDAVRTLGKADLAACGAEFERKARAALREVVIFSIREDWSIAKLGLLVRLFGQLGDSRILVEFATDELFHEMGVWPEIEPYLHVIAADEEGDPETRLWALDGLVFNDLREGNHEAGRARVDAMHALLEAHDLGGDEWLAWGMKRMLLMSMAGDVDGVHEMLGLVETRLPAKAEHRRIFRYNRALAFFKLEQNDLAMSEAAELVEEYYKELGLTPADVLGRNAPELRPLLPKGRDNTDTLKHLADTLDLLAQAAGEMSQRSSMARIHAMKFYELAHAFESFVRVGQDLVDEFVWVNDFIGAREIMERNIFPTLQAIGLVSYVLPVRALYAVVLAYCDDHEAAANEVAWLMPYEEAMAPEHRNAFQDQKQIISDVRRFGGPLQRQVSIPAPLQALFDQRRGAPRAVEPRRKIGRNERCPCGSGRKYKQCHGR